MFNRVNKENALVGVFNEYIVFREVSLTPSVLSIVYLDCTDLLELPHVGSVHAEGGEERARLLQHARPVHQAGQRDPALQSDVVVQLHNNYISTTLRSLMNPM